MYEFIEHGFGVEPYLLLSLFMISPPIECDVGRQSTTRRRAEEIQMHARRTMGGLGLSGNPV